MAAPVVNRLNKRPLDKWSTRERLALASSVRMNGDQNWISVSRAIRAFAEDNRPSDWFSQKNCALQYADLLEKVETPKRKRGEKGEREIVETPANQIMHKMTMERIKELKQLIEEEQQKYKKLKTEVEELRSGRYDDNLMEMLEKMQEEKLVEEEKRKEEEKKFEEELAERAREKALRQESRLQRGASTVSTSEMDESTQDSIIEHLNVETTDDDQPATPLVIQPMKIEIPTSQPHETAPPVPPTSPLLSSLLQSKQCSVDSLQQIKEEAEAEHALKQQSQANYMAEIVQEEEQTVMEYVPVSEVGEVSEDNNEIQVQEQDQMVVDEIEIVSMSDVKTEVDIETMDHVVDIDASHIKEEIVEFEHHMVVEEIVEVVTHESPVKVPPVAKIETAEIVPLPIIEESVFSDAIPENNLVQLGDDGLVKQEPPLSPASSISSRFSDTGSKSSIKKKEGQTRIGSRQSRSTRPSNATDDLSSRPSDAEFTDDDGDSSGVNLAQSMGLALSESIPNSPQSSHCSDTEDEKSYKAWKKSIMLVWRAAANHKYATVFLHPVTDDIAPGYSTVVRRPKDLTGIKRNIENGMIRTTAEFQRDMMLMFTNAMMYNSSDHNVYNMADVMYGDVLEQIETALMRCGLNLGEAIETANNRPDWKRLWTLFHMPGPWYANACRHIEVMAQAIRQYPVDGAEHRGKVVTTHT